MTRLAVHDLHVYLGDSYVIQGATLDVDSSRAVAILGRNGVGKTTLLRAIMGLCDPPREGSVHWGDVEKASSDMTRRPAWHRNAEGIAYVPQGRRIFPSLSVEENLRVALRPPRPGAAPWTLVELFELFPNLHERRRQPGTALSGGEQQMLAIARALVSNPSLLLLDEPTEGLAPIMVQRILDVLIEVRRKGLGILLVEQNFRFAGALTEEVVVMQAGRFIYKSESVTAAEIEQVAERYLGVGAVARDV